MNAATSAVTAGKTSPQKDSKSVLVENARITAGQTNTVDITFVPKTVRLITVYCSYKLLLPVCSMSQEIFLI